MNFLKNYRRLFSIILFENKPFEDVFATPKERAGKRIKKEVYKIFENTIWKLYMRSITKHDAMVHVDIDHEKKRLKAIIFIDKGLYNNLFGKYIFEQQMRELARLINMLGDSIEDIDWIEFVLEIEGE